MEESKRVFKQFETATGRKLSCKPIERTHLYEIVFCDGRGGNIPRSYSGTYTSEFHCEQAILAFVKETFQVAEEHNTSKKKVS